MERTQLLVTKCLLGHTFGLSLVHGHQPLCLLPL